ncbi:MAG: hypothetical protein Q8942_03860 [Bacillota bacterium]|nr:hypothetical protein [Bacillota bacterium]
MMKFSDKDKRILIFLGIFLSVFFLWKFLLNPQLNSIFKLKRDAVEKSNTYAQNLSYKDKSNNIESELKILNQKLQDLKVSFPSDMNYDEIYVIIKELSIKSGVKIINLKFDEKTSLTSGSANETSSTDKNDATNGNVDSTETSNSDLKNNNSLTESDGKKIEDFLNESGLSDNAASQGKSSIKNGEGYKVVIKVTGSGKMSQIESLLNYIEALKNKVEYNQLQINKVQSDTLNFNLKLGFLGISGNKNRGSLVDMKGLPDSGNEKREDIFQAYDGYESSNNLNSGKNDKITVNLTVDDVKKYDFTMRVMPYGNNIAPPTVTLTAKKIIETNGLTRTPIVYGDSSKQVNVELFIEELKGKYFFKFKTDQEAYPDGFTKTVEFLPDGNDLMFLVDSTKRKYLSDKSIVNTKITNKTKKNVIVDVINEDESSPRVRFENLQPNVTINYK